MGMFDNVNYECVCPVCHTKISGFQSKDADCLLDTLEPHQVNRFYSICDKCGCWIEFERITSPVENFIMTVVGKVNGKRQNLPEHTKEVQI